MKQAMLFKRGKLHPGFEVVELGKEQGNGLRGIRKFSKAARLIEGGGTWVEVTERVKQWDNFNRW